MALACKGVGKRNQNLTLKIRIFSLTLFYSLKKKKKSCRAGLITRSVIGCLLSSTLIKFCINLWLLTDVSQYGNFFTILEKMISVSALLFSVLALEFRHHQGCSVTC